MIKIKKVNIIWLTATEGAETEVKHWELVLLVLCTIYTKNGLIKKYLH